MTGRQYAKSYAKQLIARGDGTVSDGIKLSANHIQVGGNHYKKIGIPEHWDIVAQNNLDYFQGQITKYVMRWKSKGGIQDLKKALHFTQKYIELVEAGIIHDPTRLKGYENAKTPTPTTPPFVGPGTDPNHGSGYGVQQSSSGGGGSAYRVPGQMYDTPVGVYGQQERDRFGQQDRASVESYVQRVQTDRLAMDMSSGCDNYGRPMPDGKGRRESTGPAEQGGKSSTAPTYDRDHDSAFDGDQYLSR